MRLFHRRVSHWEIFDQYVKAKAQRDEISGLLTVVIHHLTNGDGEITFAFDRPELGLLEMAVYESKGKLTISMRPRDDGEPNGLV